VGYVGCGNHYEGDRYISPGFHANDFLGREPTFGGYEVVVVRDSSLVKYFPEPVDICHGMVGR